MAYNGCFPKSILTVLTHKRLRFTSLYYWARYILLWKLYFIIYIEFVNLVIWFHCSYTIRVAIAGQKNKRTKKKNLYKYMDSIRYFYDFISLSPYLYANFKLSLCIVRNRNTPFSWLIHDEGTKLNRQQNYIKSEIVHVHCDFFVYLQSIVMWK